MGISETQKDINEVKPNTDEKKIRKLCVTGKGGVGKSTISSIIARVLAQKGLKILMIDTDESNPGLYKKLEISREPVPLISYLDRFNLEYGIPEGTWISQEEIGFDEIPDEFVEANRNISLMETGKITKSLQGCACSMADFSKQLMKALVPKEDEIVIADLEAGVESFGRGIEQGADAVIAVTETSNDSISLAAQIRKMSEEVGIGKVYTICNRIPEKNIELVKGIFREICGEEPFGIITVDEEIIESGMTGGSVPESSVMFSEVKKIVDNIF